MFPEHQNSILEWFLKNSVILNTGCWKFIVAITGINYIFKYINIENSYFKVPLLRFMKGSYFGFGSPQQQVGMHARSKNTFIVLQYAFIFTLFAQWLQAIRSTIHFYKPLLCVTLICGDWSILSCLWCLIKQRLWGQCCFVYSVTGETAIFTAPKAPSDKEWLCIFIQTNAKRPTSGRAIC